MNGLPRVLLFCSPGKTPEKSVIGAALLEEESRPREEDTKGAKLTSRSGLRKRAGSRAGSRAG